jgi:uncharacterized membrane protein YeaQ/YmgE (transglycosylase-associated protein family)
MDLIVTLVMGGIIGWVASLMMASEDLGLLANVLIGIVGSVLGLWLAGFLGLAVDAGPARWLASLVGALILVAIVRSLGLSRPHGLT